MSASADLIKVIVIQPTPYCNLNCSYCYLPDRDNGKRMQLETLDAVGRHVLANPITSDSVTVVWHAGEPMTLSPAWYEEAFSCLAAAAPGRKIQHSFQSNAVGINNAWIDLWAQWDVVIGVSLDGPADLHDRHRKTRGGRGSFALTMRGVEQLQARGYPFHIISVLTSESLTEPDRMFDFYRKHELRNVCFNVEEIEGGNDTSSLEGPEFESAYKKFLQRFMARSRSLPEPFHCREIDGVTRLIGAPAETRRHNPQVHPLELVSIAVDGKMSTFSPEFLGVKAPEFNDFVFADVHFDGPEAMLLHPAFQRLHGDITAGVEACRKSCTYFDVCGGGAPSNKYFELGSCCGTETFYCRLTRQATLEGVLAAYENDMELV